MMEKPAGQDDLRVRRTRKLLWDALMAELAERPLKEISVTDICARAMVHRTTFYKHYEDKFALLEQGMRQMYDALVAEEQHLGPDAYSPARPPPYFVRLFEHVAEHRQFYTLMLCGEGVPQFQRWIKAYAAGVAETRLRHLAAASKPSVFPTAMHVQFFAGGVLSLLAWWLEHDMPLSPHQMAQYLLSVHGTASHHG